MKRKQIISLLLALLMIFTALPFSAAAEEWTAMEENQGETTSWDDEETTGETLSATEDFPDEGEPCNEDFPYESWNETDDPDDSPDDGETLDESDSAEDDFWQVNTDEGDPDPDTTESEANDWDDWYNEDPTGEETSEETDAPPEEETGDDGTGDQPNQKLTLKKALPCTVTPMFSQRLKPRYTKPRRVTENRSSPLAKKTRSCWRRNTGIRERKASRCGSWATTMCSPGIFLPAVFKMKF